MLLNGMATAKLKDFKDSAEETILQECLKDMRILKSAYMNLVIQSCNVMKPVPFTDADFVLLPFFERRKEKLQEGIPNSDIRYKIIRLENLLNSEFIQKLTAGGVDAVPDECESAVLCLLEFLRGRVLVLLLA
jgi:hypothetical protein